MTKFTYDPDSRSQQLADKLAYDHAIMMRELIRARRASGLTRGNVADMLGEPESVILEFETTSDPTLSLLRRYAHAVGARIRTEVTT